MRTRLALCALALLPACSKAPVISMDFSRPEMFDAPFPSQDLLKDGRLHLAGYPGRELGQDLLRTVGRDVTDLLGPEVADYVRDDLFFVASALSGLEDQGRGFGLNSGVFFKVRLPEDPEGKRLDLFTADRAREWKLPTREASVEKGSTVFLVDVDSASPGSLHRYPIDVGFSVKTTQYRPAFLLSVVPWQGQPLAPGALHAAVVMTGVGGPERFARPEFVAALLAGRPTPEIDADTRAAYDRALAALEQDGVDLPSIAGLAVFRTDDPMAALAQAFETARQDGIVTDGPLVKTEQFDDYCVYHTTVRLPVYQRGTPPFLPTGGEWTYGPDGKLLLQHREQANVWLTLPRRPVPAGGFPLVVFVRTGGGGERPLLERGVSDANWDTLVPGTGPAMEFAREGYAALSVDGPHGGLRNVLHFDEQVLVFNFLNPGALRDNIRQTAVEQALLAEWVTGLSVDADDCPGLAQAGVSFDASHLALMGHSMGATIAPLVAALEPRYRAVILSGAGASWIENVLFKQKPFPVKELAELMIGYVPTELDRFDPVLSLVQWAADDSDPLNYNRYLLNEADAAHPRHVLMLQGIVDHYIMPSIANAGSASLGLDPAGEPLDQQTLELMFTSPSLDGSLRWSGRSWRPYPVSGNRDGRTAVVVQHRQDSVRDGHEVVFQTEAPKVQYRCFLRSFRVGTPVVVDPASGCD